MRSKAKFSHTLGRASDFAVSATTDGMNEVKESACLVAVHMPMNRGGGSSEATTLAPARQFLVYHCCSTGSSLEATTIALSRNILMWYWCSSVGSFRVLLEYEALFAHTDEHKTTHPQAVCQLFCVQG